MLCMGEKPTVFGNFALSMRCKIHSILFALLVINQVFAQVSASVLAQGDWAKVAVQTEGVYKLFPSDLESLGLGTAPFVTADIGVFGRHAGVLPERNDQPRDQDLLPLHIWIQDGGDGSFGGNDCLYFYAQAPHTWVHNSLTGRFDFFRNPYSDVQSYFVTTTEGGERIQAATSLQGSPLPVARFTHVAHHEADLQNLVGSGRQWFGELFDYTLSRDFDLGLDALDASSIALFRARGVGRSTVLGTELQLSTAQGPVGSIVFGSIAGSSGADYVDEGSLTAEQSANLSIWGPLTMEYDRAVNTSAMAWLDYVNVNADAPFRWRQAPQVWRFSPSDTAVIQANLSMVTGGLTANGKAWDVRNPLQPLEVAPIPFNANGSAYWGLKLPGDQPCVLTVFEPSTTPTPTLLGRVANQDLHGAGPLKYVIVAPAHLMNEAQRLALFHEKNGLTTRALEVQTVYNEFSAGVQDITAIKDFMRYLWETADSAPDRPEYLLLFGDASYDYKGLIEPNTNQIPIYQSYSSFSLYSSFSTDDFFGFLGPNEGNNLRAKDLDLGIGRIPVNTVEEAAAVVDKILAYSDPVGALGAWRKKVLFVSDDVDKGWEAVLTSIPNVIADRMDTTYPFLDIDKMYADSYEQQSSSASQNYPRLRTELLQAINEGNLVTTYVGHGGEVGWASENILQLNDTKTFSNGAKLPLFVTVTCEFSRLDDPLRTSAGEFLLLNPDGGAIALLSTTRVVYVDGAATLNDSIFRVIFEKENGRYRTFGQILRSAKNGTTSADKLRFSLLGDPALRLNVPEHRIVLDSLNNTYFTSVTSSENDTLQALSRVRISGHVQDAYTGEVATQFHGPVQVILYDKKAARSTLRNDDQGPAIPFEEWAHAAYRGNVLAEAGYFDAEWVMPLDIALQLGQGKFSMYAETDSTDASGSDFRVWIGGIDPDAPVDITGPTVRVFMGDSLFVEGGITGQDPMGLVLLFDENGINAVGNGIGHDLKGTLDGDWNAAFSMNQRYTAEAGTYKRGQATWPFQDLTDGPHTFSVRAWDSYNNFAEGNVSFTVVSRESFQLGAFRIYPNPGVGPFFLDIEHNAAKEELSAVWEIVSPEGQVVFRTQWQGEATSAVLQTVEWDGTDGQGHLLPAGWYFARVQLTRMTDGQRLHASERIILLH
ncbi:MAG: hypothetical protein ABR87_03320 [Cryomorphaceae bacterium BACL7 MAG-121220-bin83]|jgi:hypothetical protein|nr:MAG: hypothetical protein ABR87_03320 [Cryomorphaceae bacterium BACL7 MAG-121220-bin83]